MSGVNSLGCPAGFYFWAAFSRRHLLRENLSRKWAKTYCVPNWTTFLVKKKVCPEKTNFLGRSFGQVFKTTILGRSSGQKRKKSKIDSQQKRWKQRFFFVFWVGTVSNYCCNNFSTKKSRYLKKYSQKMSAHFFDSVQKPGKTVFNFWIRKKVVQKGCTENKFSFFCPELMPKKFDFSGHE